MSRRRLRHPEAAMEEIARKADGRRMPETGLREQWWIHLQLRAPRVMGTLDTVSHVETRGPVKSREEALSSVRDLFKSDNLDRYAGATVRLAWK